MLYTFSPNGLDQGVEAELSLHNNDDTDTWAAQAVFWQWQKENEEKEKLKVQRCQWKTPETPWKTMISNLLKWDLRYYKTSIKIYCK